MTSPIQAVRPKNEPRTHKAEIRPPAPKQRRVPAPLTERTPITVRNAWYLLPKSILDRVLAGFLIVLASPMILFLAALVKISSRGPAFYTQIRVGRHGRRFSIIKIRTMIHNCESLTGPRWSIPGDPRITGVGRFLRLTHLDELPQLFNVFLGHMSLIGPRPERPEFLPELIQAYPAYPERLRIMPGVTGLAQIQLPSDTDIEGVSHKLGHDLYYVRHVNPYLDLRILLGTLLFVAQVPLEKLRRWIGLPRPEFIEKEMQADIVSDLPVRTSA